MRKTEKVEKMSLRECVLAWNKFKVIRRRSTKSSGAWFLTVDDRESMIEKFTDIFILTTLDEIEGNYDQN